MSLSPSYLLKPLAMKPSFQSLSNTSSSSTTYTPLQDCRFRVYGCHTRVNKEMMEQHMSSSTNVHLHLLLSKLTDLERSSRLLDHRISDIEYRYQPRNMQQNNKMITMGVSSMMSKHSDIHHIENFQRYEQQHDSIKEINLLGIPSIPSIQSMTSLSSITSNDDEDEQQQHASRKRRRDVDDEITSDDDDQSTIPSPSYGAHVHESLVHVASLAQQAVLRDNNTTTTSPSMISRSGHPLTATALRRREARRLKRQRALSHQGIILPKKPKTAYNYYQNISRSEIQQEMAQNDTLYSQMTREEKAQHVARVIGERWKALNEEQRKPFQLQADADKERYKQECDKYNHEHGTELNVDVSNTTGTISTSTSPISMSSSSPVSPHSPVSPILTGTSAFHRASSSVA